MSTDQIPSSQVILLDGVPPPSSPSARELNRLRRELIKWHQKTLLHKGAAVAGAIMCGFLALRLKDGLKRGEFIPWVEQEGQTEFGFGLRTVQRYMRLAKAFLDFANSQGVRCETEHDLRLQLDSPVLNEFDALLRAERQLAQVDPNDWLSPRPVLDAVTSVLEEIECDPCALSDEWKLNLAEINITPFKNGLAKGISWGRKAWVCPGHEADPAPWFDKAQAELAAGNLQQAVLCVPESALTLPVDLLRYPIAVTSQPLTVTVRRSGRTAERQLPTRSLFVYLTSGEADLERFARAFRDIAVVFAPIAIEA